MQRRSICSQRSVNYDFERHWGAPNWSQGVQSADGAYEFRAPRRGGVRFSIVWFLASGWQRARVPVLVGMTSGVGRCSNVRAERLSATR